MRFIRKSAFIILFGIIGVSGIKIIGLSGKIKRLLRVLLTFTLGFNNSFNILFNNLPCVFARVIVFCGVAFGFEFYLISVYLKQVFGFVIKRVKRFVAYRAVFVSVSFAMYGTAESER